MRKDSESGTLSRRSFLKSTGLAAGVLGFSGEGMLAVDNWLSPTKANAEVNEETRIMCHWFHCLGGCGHKCTVRDGRLVKIEPVEFEDGTRGRLCARGLSEVQHVYDVDRIQTPLKRVGERGEGKFEPISWEEAIKTIADAIKESQSKYGENSFYFRKSPEARTTTNVDFISKLLHADTGGLSGIDRGQANGSDPSGLTSNARTRSSIWDWENAGTILHIGSNILESSVVNMEAFFNAKEGGTKMIAVDPRFSTTASKCHQWLPIKPGTDASLLLAIVKIILDEKWYDESHILAKTSFPFLVDETTGEVLGRMEERTDSAGKVSQVKIPMVWDTVTESAQDHNAEGVVPALTGSYTVEDRKAITEFDLLKKQMSSYTPEWASEVCGIASDVIVDVADQYANNGPSTINYGFGGPDKYANADIVGHAASIMVALTGNSGKPGTGIGYTGYGNVNPAAAGVKSWPLPAEFAVSKNTVQLFDMPFKENNIHVGLTFGDSITLTTTDLNKTIDWVKTLDFFAVAEIYYSSTVPYADIVLPVCSKYECREEVNCVRTGVNYPDVYLTQQVIEPLFESKTDLEIEYLLAKEFGLEQHLPKSHEELAKFMLSEPKGNMEGFTYDVMRKAGVKRLLDSSEIVYGFKDGKYPTTSGKIELYYENKLEDKLAFPQYEDANEVYDANPLKEKYPLAFVQGKTRFSIHAYFSSAKWIQDYYGPLVQINPNDAAARGVKTGDDVKVFNDRGYFVCRVAVDGSIQPGMLFMAGLPYTHLYKEGTLQNVTNAYRSQRHYKLLFGSQIPFNDALVELVKA